MLWLKAFHLVFVTTWFAGLFYLPRLFVYHAQSPEPVVRERLQLMQRRLLGITHIGGALAIGFGLATVLVAMVQAPGYLQQGWLHAKLALVALLIGYHLWCAKLVADLRRDRITHSPRWFRFFNELPALLLIAIVLLVVLKPF